MELGNKQKMYNYINNMKTLPSIITCYLYLNQFLRNYSFVFREKKVGVSQKCVWLSTIFNSP